MVERDPINQGLDGGLRKARFYQPGFQDGRVVMIDLPNQLNEMSVKRTSSLKGTLDKALHDHLPRRFNCKILLLCDVCLTFLDWSEMMKGQIRLNKLGRRRS